MHKNVGEAIEACRRLEELAAHSLAEVVVCAPFTSLSALNALGLTKIKLGAQNMHFADQGAFTGEISGQMLIDVGCQYVIIGHSERRALFGEDDGMVNKKVLNALKLGLRPILCVGETLTQRQSGETETIVIEQTQKALSGVTPEQLGKVVIAYEPIWAIGTGETSTAEDANKVIGVIRAAVAELYDAQLAEEVRIQYGGSVKPENVAGFKRQPQIDGALVGGASIKVQDFMAIIDG